MGPKFQFLKKVFPTTFFTQNMFHISHWLKPKRHKFFRAQFSKMLTSYCPPMGPKFQFPKNVFPKAFLIQKTCFTTFHVDWSQKFDKNFFEPTFQKFLQVIVPAGPKFRFLRKVCPTNFFTHKTCFITFHVDWSQKIDKNFFKPIFQKFLQVTVPLWDQNFNFRKMCFRQLFLLTKHVS